jgi:hypothetical protein
MTPKLKYSDFRSPILAPVEEEPKRANSQVGIRIECMLERASVHSLEDISFNNQLPIADYQNFDLHDNLNDNERDNAPTLPYNFDGIMGQSFAIPPRQGDFSGFEY